MSKDKVKTVTDYLSAAYSDEQVKKIPELEKLIFAAAMDVDKGGSIELMSAKLCRDIGRYVLMHQDKSPKALITLYNQLVHDAAKYEGVALSTMMLPIWF
ncbi:bacteriocin immunity protein [Enterococcus sp. HY326]|uniref:bacteriocin immunity protein n=1 Tax=Enterococcus sp. HY326 TaxID=2971265 RepID=UPI00223F5425|nr:bacteriocin immunity protein [Enterococcus sp. HY326]